MRWLVLLALSFTALSSFAQIYRWTDKDGRTHFSNVPPPEGAAG